MENLKFRETIERNDGSKNWIVEENRELEIMKNHLLTPGNLLMHRGWPGGQGWTLLELTDVLSLHAHENAPALVRSDAAIFGDEKYM